MDKAMKDRLKYLFAVLLLLLLMPFTSCVKYSQNAMGFNYEDSKEWGKVVTRELPLPTFAAIETSGAVRVVLTQDSNPSVRVYGNEKCIDAYDIEVHSNELNVSLKDHAGQLSKQTPSVIVYVSVPAMEEIELSGAGELYIQGSMVQDADMKIRVNGSGKVEMDTLRIRNLDMVFSGAAELNISEAVVAEDAKIKVNGAGNITANVF